MIDLAGSERAAQTQNTGRRMMEGIDFFFVKTQKEDAKKFHFVFKF